MQNTLLPVSQFLSFQKLTPVMTRALRLLTVFVVVIPMLFVSALPKKSDTNNRSNVAKVCVTEACIKTAHRILGYMDPRINPCDDFYKFACGNYLENVEIPPNKLEKWFLSDIGDQVHNQLRPLLSMASEEADPWSEKLVRQLYSLCMDENKIDSRGLKPGHVFLKSVGGWPLLDKNWTGKNWNWLDTEVKLRKMAIVRDNGLFFSLSVKRDSEIATLTIGTNSFSNEEFTKIKITNVAMQFGARTEEIQEDAAAAAKFYEELLDITKEPVTKYTTIRELEGSVRWIDWMKLLDGIWNLSIDDISMRQGYDAPPPPTSPDLPRDETILLTLPENYFRDLRTLLQKYPKRILANYMLAELAAALSPLLTNNTSAHSSKPNGRNGRPRSSVCINSSLKYFPLVVWSMYVRSSVSRKVKEPITQMADRIRSELIEEIRNSKWMVEFSKNQEVAKTLAVQYSIGYTEEMLNGSSLDWVYNNLVLDSKNYLEAVLSVARWRQSRWWQWVGLHRNKDLDQGYYWIVLSDGFTSHSPSFLQIHDYLYFSASGFQPPTYTEGVPFYVNYGTTGTMVGHELSHGFYYRNLKYNQLFEKEDGYGNQIAAAKKRKQCFIDQYSSFKVNNDDTLQVDGNKTLQENVVDNMGLKLAYRAYRKLIKGKREAVLPELEYYSADQLFLISTANFWCAKHNMYAIRYRLRNDEHSLSEFRVNGMMMNFADFGDIFHCAPGDPMNPVKKCKVL